MARVLIIDDAARLRLLYRLELEAEGYEIFEAGSGAEALQVLAHEAIDAVVLDLLLPDGLGLQLLDEILSQRRHLPLVINTAYSQFRDNFQTWGAEAFVLKSSDLTELKSALRQAVSAQVESASATPLDETNFQQAHKNASLHPQSSPPRSLSPAEKMPHQSAAPV